MRQKWIDRLVAGLVLAWALGLYLATMAPTVSFWDPGERIASAYRLQVMHPPGAPFYLLLARVFSMVAPSQASVALAVNLLSVLASAGTVLFTHLIIVRLVRRWQGDLGDRTALQDSIALASGVVGAVTFSVSDSFWFNAGISEVYALSTFFTAVVVWLVLRWSEAVRRERRQVHAGPSTLFQLDANRYLVLIAALFGMAIGVHLLSLLAFFFVGLIVFFVGFDRAEVASRRRGVRLAIAGVVISGVFLILYPGIVKGLPKLFAATGTPLIAAVIVVGLVVCGVYATHRRPRPRAHLAFTCLAVILIGYASYALVFIRSATEPPIDIGDPDNIERFIDYLEREQYGDTPLLRGVTFNDRTGRVNPRTGETTFFPRRHSIEPKYWEVYEQYDSDLAFFLDYQVGHMYLRYFLWNFSGRASDVQGASALTGLPFLDPPSAQETVTRTSSGALETPPADTRNVYFALPLLLGVFGAVYHARRDGRRALSVAVLFFMTGLGIVIYLNQTPMQPRERDYSYVGSFLAFSLWVGIGAGGILRMTYESVRGTLSQTGRRAVLFGVGLLVFCAVPGWMTLQNYGDHDRSDNYVPRDYAYNVLTSVEENAILFTNGDNDTYPLWYLQNVEGVRQDVRVVVLSFLNTPWYSQQLKGQADYASDPLPIALSNDQIQTLRPETTWTPRQVEVPVDSNSLSAQWTEYTSAGRDSSVQESPMTWTLKGRSSGRQRRYLTVADLMAYNILRTNAQKGWKRPIYFATTVSPSARLNLQSYFQHEGQAYRVLPLKHSAPNGRVIPGLTDKRIADFRFTGLRDSTAHYHADVRSMVDNYRPQMAYVARRLARKGHPGRAREVLERVSSSVSFEAVPARFSSLLAMAQAYRRLGDTEQVADLLHQAEPAVLHQLANAGSRRAVKQRLRLIGYIRTAYAEANRTAALEDFEHRVEQRLQQHGLDLPDARTRTHDRRPSSSGEP